MAEIFESQKADVVEELKSEFETLVAQMEQAESEGNKQLASQLEAKIMDVLAQVKEITGGNTAPEEIEEIEDLE